MMHLLKYAFELSKKADWSFNASLSFLEICDFEVGNISNLKKSNDDVIIFLNNFFKRCLNSDGTSLSKIDKKQIKLILEKILEKDFQNIDVLLDKNHIEDLEYRHYEKKPNKFDETIKFADLYEYERIKRQKDSFDSTYGVLKEINSKVKDFDDKSVWDSLRNGINYLSEIWEKNPYQCVKILLDEYENGSKCAYKNILDLSKDASRQNLSEELQQEMWSNSGIPLKRLPQSGEDSLHVYNGEIVRGKDLSKKEKELAPKALDFEINGEHRKILTYNKYNKWVGGSTGDVFKDVRKLIELAKSTKEKFLFILDGKYWNDGKRDTLKEYNSENILVSCTDDRHSDEVKKFINS